MTFKINPYKDHAVMGEGWESTAHELFTVAKQRKTLAKREDFLRDKLQALSMDKSARTAKYAYSKVERGGSVDYKLIIEEHLNTLDVEPYRKQVTFSWRITRI